MPNPPINRATKQTKGGRQYRTRGTPAHDGRAHTAAPALHPPCHPTSSCHPPIHDSPTHHRNEGVADRGHPTTQTPRRHTPPHTTHPATRQCTTQSQYRQYCTRIDRMRTTPRTEVYQQQHTPPPFHTPHIREDGHHPLIHSHTVHVHTHQRTIMINEQQSGS